MATKRSSKSSSKTEHVLNLLSNPAQEAAANETQEEATSQINEAKAPAAQNEPQVQGAQKQINVPIVEVARTDHEEVADKISSALDTALNEELEKQGEAQTAANETPEVNTPDSPPIKSDIKSDTEKEPAEEQNNDDAPVENAENVTVSKSSAENNEELNMRLADEAESSEFVNVMEEVVESMIDKYIDMFKVCKCPRCYADIKAYALTRLPSKYVVLSKTTRAPMVSFYARKFETEVKNQLIFATSLIKESPRHSAEFRKNY